MKRCKKCSLAEYREKLNCSRCGSTSFFEDVFEGLKVIPTREPFGKKIKLVEETVDKTKFNKI